MLKKPSLCHIVQIKGPFWKSFGYSSWEDLFLCTDCKKKNSELLVCIICYNQLCYYFSLFVETINKHFWGVLIGSIPSNLLFGCYDVASLKTFALLEIILRSYSVFKEILPCFLFKKNRKRKVSGRKLLIAKTLKLCVSCVPDRQSV